MVMMVVFGMDTVQTLSSREILIIPVGKIPSHILNELAPELEKRFRLPVHVASPLRIQEAAYNPRRKQYKAGFILEAILTEHPKQKYRLGIVDLDLYVPQLNFVFGLADSSSGAAVISITRLRPEFYGHAPNDLVMHRRICIESVHELGHVFGLRHCPNPRCVMHFSNSIMDTDIKGPDFCNKCQKLLLRIGAAIKNSGL